MKKYVFFIASFLFGFTINARAQCNVQTRFNNAYESIASSLYCLNNKPLGFSNYSLTQLFTTKCAGKVKQLQLGVGTLNDGNPPAKLDISFYRGKDPNDSTSKLIYQIKNYSPKLLLNGNCTNMLDTLQIPLNLRLSAKTDYYFTITNSMGGDFPNNFSYRMLNLNVGNKGLWMNNKVYSWGYDNNAYLVNDLAYVLNIIPDGTTNYAAISQPILPSNLNNSSNFNFNGYWAWLNDTNTNINITNADNSLQVSGLKDSLLFAVGNNANAPVYKLSNCFNPKFNNVVVAASKDLSQVIEDTVTLTAIASPNMALSFNEFSHVSIAQNVALLTYNESTYEAWINCSNVSALNTIFSKIIDWTTINGGKTEKIFAVLSNKLYLFQIMTKPMTLPDTLEKTEFNGTINNNEWTHVALVFDNINAYVYVNGNLVDTKPLYLVADPIDAALSPIWVGKGRSPNNFFSGQMDEVRIWNVARTADEIKTNYNKTVYGGSAGLMAYYKFDNQSDDGSLAIDASANGNHAMLANAAAWVIGSLDIPKYTYQWSNNATGQNIIPAASGNYFYKVTDIANGCSATSPVVTVNLAKH